MENKTLQFRDSIINKLQKDLDTFKSSREISYYIEMLILDIIRIYNKNDKL